MKESHPHMPVRPRRLRQSSALRSLVRETNVGVTDLIHPAFVMPGRGIKKEIAAMPGQFQQSVDELLRHVEEVVELGLSSVLLFGIPESKDGEGSVAWSEEGIIQQASRALKESFPHVTIIADLCFCEYTDHGHCGVLHEGPYGTDVENDVTIHNLGKQAVSLAAAGVDVVAPSANMDGMVGAIRKALDEDAFHETVIMSYAVKYFSAFYGPFRQAVDSAPSFGDRQTYQMDPANAREAVKEALLDVEEGADILMVKPALSYLDIISKVKEATNLPLAAYNVSGEYSMIKHAARVGLVDEERVVHETLTSMKRAGADMIITYFAADYARMLRRLNG